MKKNLLLPLFLVGLVLPAAAQTCEITGRAGLGLMRFGGPDAQPSSLVLYIPNESGISYTNSPYGSRLGTGVALGLRVQRVGEHRGLLALDLGYEWLRSRTNITQVDYSPSVYSSFRGTYSADGATSLYSQNLTTFLGLGHRFELGTVAVDVLAGPELAYVFSFREKGSGTYDGGKGWATDQRDRAYNRFDARLRADATAWCHRLGFNASYSHGFINYQSGLKGASPEVYARILRLGLAYRLH
ncbi:hypothetical protein GCM10022409_07550 [Hymenobacter glaciei]|uniref:Outer membrane protein beta-barrel domain-containing protein n=1 Tax=Hymenobacter glaciei TaxID=877209 RepID=A0ABP7TH70_9BACT